MRIYLPGPEGPDQLATKWLLIQRNYRVECYTDLKDRTHWLNHGHTPTATQLRTNELTMMVQCDVVVLDPDAQSVAQVIRLLDVCRFGGIPAVRLEDLPLMCPCNNEQWERMIEEMDLVAASTPAPRPKPMPRPSLQQRIIRLLCRVQGAMNAFDQRYAWFFTNGMKQHRLAQHPEEKAYPIAQD